LYSWCKRCCAVYDAARQLSRRKSDKVGRPPKQVVDGQLRCGTCGESKAVDAFAVDRTVPGRRSRWYLEARFQPGMMWSNYGKWHIDHVVALARFDLTDPEQCRRACHFTNLQPLWAAVNLSKGSRVTLCL
jgi:hypothetical protein